MSPKKQVIDPRAKVSAKNSNNDGLSKKEQKRIDKQNKKNAQIQVAEEYYEYESAASIDVSSLKKAKRYKKIGLLIFILAVVASLLYFFAFQQSISGKQNQCWTYQQSIESMTEQYITVNGFSSYPAYIEDIPNSSANKKDCPSGGSYTWNPVTGQYSCSEHGHYPNTFNKIESVTQSVIQTPTNVNESK